jgi:macrophage erythroblast attacher
VLINGIPSRFVDVERLSHTQLTDIHTNSTVPTQVALRQRIQHIAALETMTGTDDPNLDPWSNTRLNRWLVDWALRNDREETAKQLAEASGIGVSAVVSSTYKSDLTACD